MLDLFSGIGGFSLGLERTGGFETVAFCEIEQFPRKVLAKHWPEVPCYEDVRKLTAVKLAADGITVDVICGGFPCQDISTAGKGAGIAGARSGLWKEYARLISEIRPRFVIVENVSALLGRGLDVVLGDLAEIGYDAEWHCIPVSAIGAPHRRDRIWIVANAECIGSSRQGQHEYAISPEASSDRQTIKFVDGSFANQWSVEPNVGRVAHGVPNRVDRLKALGNSVVPQIPEMIGNAILENLKQN